MGKPKKENLDQPIGPVGNDSSDEANQIPQQTTDPLTERMISHQTNSALLYLLFYSILMFTLPFGAFFGTQHLLREHTDYSSQTITTLSVISSVVMVYIVIGLYVYHAYHEKDVQIGPDGKAILKDGDKKKK